MSADAEDDGAKVHRLLDMVVEEVSLVDRAANKRRFLVIKRGAMPKDDQGKSGKPPKDEEAKPKGKAKPPFPPEKASDKADAEPNAGGDKGKDKEPAAPKGKKPPPFPPKGKQPAKKAEGDVLTIATRALETLTDAVEQMGEAEDDEANKVAGQLVEELAEITADLAAAAGLDPTEDEEAEKSAGQADAGAATSDAAQTAATEVRALLGQVSQLLAAATAKADGSAADSDSLSHADTDPAPPPAPEVEERLNAQLQELHTSVRALGDSIRDQGLRLNRLEKAAPLPNSRATERAPTPQSPDGWPLDMNRPLDRGRVDKSVSFHDD